MVVLWKSLQEFVIQIEKKLCKWNMKTCKSLIVGAILSSLLCVLAHNLYNCDF